MASQVRSRVKTVEELVRLGQQRENTQTLSQPTHPLISAQPTTSSQVFCWKCKGSHPPYACPNFNQQKKYKPSITPQGQPQQSWSAEMSQPSASALGPMENRSSASLPFQSFTPAYGHHATSAFGSPLPQQLKVPLTISSWKETAILDSGSSYTLVNEQIWNDIKPPEAKLNLWTDIPLYLANGKPEHPLGWADVDICLHGKTWLMPVVVLSPQALAFSVVLGLDLWDAN